MNEEVYELINVDEDDLDLDTQWLTSECYLSSSPRAVKKVRRCFIFFEQLKITKEQIRKGYLDLFGKSLFAFILRSHGVEQQDAAETPLPRNFLAGNQFQRLNHEQQLRYI